MPNNSRRWLIESLERLLIPAFQTRGFELIPLTDEEAQSPEFRMAFPFGRLRRESRRGIEQVEIQVDKNGEAKFRINFGEVPIGGVDHALAGHIDQEQVRVHDLSRHFEAYSSPFFRRWFAPPSRWFRHPLTSFDCERLVKMNLGLVDEVEDALRHGTRGPHVRIVEI